MCISTFFHYYPPKEPFFFLKISLLNTSLLIAYLPKFNVTKILCICLCIYMCVYFTHTKSKILFHPLGVHHPVEQGRSRLRNTRLTRKARWEYYQTWGRSKSVSSVGLLPWRNCMASEKIFTDTDIQGSLNEKVAYN